MSLSESGERWVRFEYCISCVAVTIRRQTEPIRLDAGEPAWPTALPYVVLSLCLGWWGIPWGVLLTPIVCWINLMGGHRCDPPRAE